MSTSDTALLVAVALFVSVSRVWLVRALAPQPAWSLAVVVGAAMEAIDVLFWLVSRVALVRAACAIACYVAILLLAYGRDAERTFSASSALTVAGLSSILHWLIAFGASCFFLMWAAAPVPFGALVLAALALALCIRAFTAWRARALDHRMHEAGAADAAPGG